jgi:hypothetical protein
MATINNDHDPRNLKVRGFAFTWASKSNSSKRTVATANAMASVKDKDHHSNRRKKARQTKKQKKIAGLALISTNADKSVTPSVAKGMTFGSSPADLGLDIHTSENGLVHWAKPDESIFSVIVIPRGKTIQFTSQDFFQKQWFDFAFGNDTFLSYRCHQVGYVIVMF